jgi:outer membrane protein OmpA-like peptidoglycan-associated protein
MSNLEIQSNYREQLQKLGAEILYTEDGRTVAKLVKGSDERWLLVTSQETQIDVITVAKRPFKQTLQSPSGNDYPLLGHMPAYVAEKPEKRNFDKLSFPVQQGDETKDVEVQGAKFRVSYSLRPNAKLASNLEIQTNYRNALQQLGAEILYTEDGRTVARVEHEGRTIWLLVTSQETQIDISVIEEKAFQATIQPPKADALKAALDKEGHVALYVNFDFDKAGLKPDAAPVIAQVTQLLKDNADLKLRIEGHTDIIGTREHNQALSEARAKAVVAALIAAGIAADRLSAAGFGPDQPVADNENPEGRARNRRVELVKS